MQEISKVSLDAIPAFAGMTNEEAVVRGFQQGER
jgi:hypothetical protein